jgi:hypothetical protein
VESLRRKDSRQINILEQILIAKVFNPGSGPGQAFGGICSRLMPVAWHCTSSQFMDNRTDLLRQLRNLNWQLEHCETVIGNQKNIVTALGVSAADAGEAMRLLASMEAEQDKRAKEFKRLLDALDGGPAAVNAAQS